MYTWRKVKLLNGLLSHHQSCMKSAVDLSPANGVKRTVRSLPCVHHETSVFSVCCIIKKSHEALVGHSCSHIPFRCPALLLHPLFFFFFSCIRFHAAELNEHSSSTDSQHVGELGLAGCWVSVKSQIIEQKYTLLPSFPVLLLLIFNDKCKLWWLL